MTTVAVGQIWQRRHAWGYSAVVVNIVDNEALLRTLTPADEADMLAWARIGRRGLRRHRLLSTGGGDA